MVSFITNGPSAVRKYLDQTTALLEREGHEVYRFLLCDNQAAAALYRDNLKVKTALHFNSGRFKWLVGENIFNARIYRELRQYILEIKPDVVHFHHYKALRTLLVATRGFSRVWTIHALEYVHPAYELVGLPNTSQLRWPRKLLAYVMAGRLKIMRLLLDYWLWNDVWLKRTFFKATICPSREIFLLTQHYRFLSSYYIPHFTDLIVSGDVTYDNFFLFAGRLVSQKGVDYLIKGFYQAHAVEPAMRLVIAGDGKEFGYLEKLVKEYHLGQAVTFLRSLDEAELRQYYRACLGVVIPSIAGEAGPLVALEAMSFSKPIIASTVGGLVDLVKNNENGILVLPENSREIAGALELLFKNRSLASAMGNAGRDAVMTRWTAARHRDSLLSLYRSIIKIH